MGSVGFGVNARRHRAVGLLVAQVIGRLGSLFHPGRGGGLLVLGAHRVVRAVVPVLGRPLGRARRRRPPLVMVHHRRLVFGRAAGRRLRPVVMVVLVVGVVMVVVRRFRLGRGLQPVVQRQRLRWTVVVVATGASAAAVAVGRQQRVLGAPGHFVLDEPAYVRQQEHSLALAAGQQVHLIGTAGALCRVRIRCKGKTIF